MQLCCWGRDCCHRPGTWDAGDLEPMPHNFPSWFLHRPSKFLSVSVSSETPLHFLCGSVGEFVASAGFHHFLLSFPRGKACFATAPTFPRMLLSLSCRKRLFLYFAPEIPLTFLERKAAGKTRGVAREMRAWVLRAHFPGPFPPASCSFPLEESHGNLAGKQGSASGARTIIFSAVNAPEACMHHR